MINATPTGLLLSGPSSAGKTTLARTLQDILPEPWILISDGALGERFPRHRTEFVTVEWDRRLREAKVRSARAHTETGFNTILEQGLWDPWGAAMAARLLGSGRWFVVGVTCDLDTGEAREAARGDRHPGVARRQHAEVAVSHLATDFAVDSTHEDPQTLAHQVLGWLATNLTPSALRTNA